MLVVTAPADYGADVAADEKLGRHFSRLNADENLTATFGHKYALLIVGSMKEFHDACIGARM